ncbi:hypothetical protein [uncultured Lactobacillus sp.]|uniref:hypothetical protein n=1 Tax=uncultured Lactobacillus sp. TaxID=153152 RepID=UPI0026013205|nr:hypothetical protein [uncultured Lactobacillus sp.]
MKIRNKKTITVKDLEDEKIYSFDDTELEYFGQRINVQEASVEYFIDVKGYDTLIVSEADYEALQKYMEEERDVVWDDEGEA